MPTKSVYHSLSIAKNEIRLLTVEQHDSSSNALSCKLEHVSLDDSPHFVALSSSWGDPSHREPISVDNKTLHITLNLFKALTELRKRGTSRVWADAICVNQEDLEERSQQVLKMSAIYRSASSVVAWLGVPVNDLGELMPISMARRVKTIIDSLATEMNDQAAPKARSRRRRRRPKNWKAQLIAQAMEERPASVPEDWKVKFNKIPKEEWASFKDFIDNPYWERVWIIQELAMAKRLTIVWDELDIDESILLRAFQACDAFRRKIRAMRDVLDMSRVQWADIRQLWAFRDAQRNLVPVRLLNALQMSQSAKATDERDKVFALLGLTYDGPSILPIPSYTSSKEEICRQATLKLVNATGSLDSIFTQENPPGTWIMNWFNGELWSNKRMISYLLREEQCPTKPESIAHWNACGQTKPYTELSGGSLVVLGHFISCIGGTTTASGRPTESPSDKRHAPSRKPKASRRKSKASSRHHSYQKPDQDMSMEIKALGVQYCLEALFFCFRDMSAISEHAALSPQSTWQDDDLQHLFYKAFGQYLGDARMKYRWRQHEKSFFRWWSRGNSELHLSPTSPHTMQGLKTHRVGQFWKLSDHARSKVTRNASRQLQLGRKLCVLGSGHIGWVTAHARPGDQIAIIEGCTVPVVLRKNAESSKFMIIGHGVIHGLMPGQGLKSASEKIVLE